MIIGKARVKQAVFAVATMASIAGAGDYAVGWWQHGRFLETTDDAYLQADATIVAPKVPGYIQQVLVADNQHVAAGQVLAHIDPRDLEDALAEAKAKLAAGQQRIANLDAQIALQHSVMAQAAAGVTAAQAALAYAAQNSGRYAMLARNGAGTVQSAQQASATLIEAKAALRHGQATDLAAKQQVTVLETARAEAAADLQNDKAAEHQTELNLSYATITAPISGTVGDRSLRTGQYVQAGTQLMALVPLRQVYVVANFKETQLTRVVPGQQVDISVDTFPGTIVHGHVDSLAPASGLEFALLPPDNATGNFTKIVQRIPVKVTLDHGSTLLGQLRPGMSVEVTINTTSGAAAPRTQRLASE